MTSPAPRVLPLFAILLGTSCAGPLTSRAALAGTEGAPTFDPREQLANDVRDELDRLLASHPRMVPSRQAGHPEVSVGVLPRPGPDGAVSPCLASLGQHVATQVAQLARDWVLIGGEAGRVSVVDPAIAREVWAAVDRSNALIDSRARDAVTSVAIAIEASQDPADDRLFVRFVTVPMQRTVTSQGDVIWQPNPDQDAAIIGAVPSLDDPCKGSDVAVPSEPAVLEWSYQVERGGTTTGYGTQATVRTGDTVSLRVRSTTDGYLRVYNVGTSGQTYLVHPYPASASNRVARGQWVSTTPLTVSGSAGTEQLHLFFAASPAAFGELPLGSPGAPAERLPRDGSNGVRYRELLPPNAYPSEVATGPLPQRRALDPAELQTAYYEETIFIEHRP